VNTVSNASPSTTSRLGRVARWSYQHRRRTVAIWLLALIGAMAVAQSVGSRFLDDFSGGNSQSQQAQHLLATKFPSRAGDVAQIVFHAQRGTADSQVHAEIVATLASVTKLPDVTGVRSPFATEGASQRSVDGHTVYAVVQFDATADRLPPAAARALLTVVQHANTPQLSVVAGGAPIAKIEKAKFGKSEAIGILAALLILMIAFGTLVAASLPILTALFGLAISGGVLDLISHGRIVPSFAPALAALLGIGVGIDYALFIVTRYRERLAAGDEPEAAVVTAVSTAGRAVLFAGSTVVVSLLGLFLVGLPYIVGAALGAMSAVLLVMTAALTLLPAVLGLLGSRIDRIALPTFGTRKTGQDNTWSWRWSHVIQRRPRMAAAVAAVALIVLSLPLLGLRLGYGDAGNDARGTETRGAYDQLRADFGAGSVGPLVVAAALPTTGDATSGLASLRRALQTQPDVRAVSAPILNSTADTAVLTVVPASSPQDQRTQTLVQRIRDDVIPRTQHTSGIKVLIGGETAASIDSAQHLSGRLPLVIGFVVLLSVMLIVVALRSVTIAVKAALMNLLSTGAAYGVIVAVFQWGWLGGVFNIGRTGPIDPWIPVMLFTILFGLSMDYELFLMSRVREHWLRHRDTQAAVTDGLTSTARVITAAAGIMVCVFASFVLSDTRPLKIFGLGMATAVLVDATIVRLVFVPALMQLLGRAAWWMPAWLDRFLPAAATDAEPVAPVSLRIR
jgi:putative drug exporter of the RND superfamily